MVSLESPLTLSDQLAVTVGASLVVSTGSNLPQGSGLGTSSILAGAVLKAIGECVDVTYVHTLCVCVCVCVCVCAQHGEAGT